MAFVFDHLRMANINLDQDNLQEEKMQLKMLL